MGDPLERLCFYQKRTLILITSWLPLEQESPRTEVLSVVYSLRILLLPELTREKHGYFWALPTATHFCTMTNFRKRPRKVFESITLSPVNKPIPREAKCTSKTRWKNTPMKFSKNLKRVHTSISVV